MELYKGDCLELMKNIPDGSVDMVLCDLPYGTTQCEWDKCIPFPPLWEQYKRVCKENAAIVLFSSQPFTTDLINSNRKMFRYEIVWEKSTAAGYFNANKMPMKIHENLVVFYKHLPIYNPQKRLVKERYRERIQQKNRAPTYGKANSCIYANKGTRFPTDVIKFSSWNGALFGKTDNATKHPTQKPVPLLEYLIKTYTNEGDLVLDNCMGSGSTGVACVNTGRDFIGIELDEHFYQIACERIGQAQEQIKLPLEKTTKPKEYTKMQLDLSDLIV